MKRGLELGVVAVLLVSACSLDSPNYTDRVCPCIAGWRCDAASNRCVQTTDRLDGGAGLIGLEDFRAAWATPNQVRWSWRSVGDAADFLRYELYVGRSEEEVRERVSALHFTSDENPELGRFLLPRTGGEERVAATTSDLLEPDTQYFAQLVVHDTQLNETWSNIAAARTELSPLNQLLIYEDTDLGGWLQPACISQSSTKPHAGQQSYAYTVQCNGAEAACSSSGSADCWLQMKLGGRAIDLSGLTAGTLQGAYVEYAFALDSPVAIYWGAVNLSAASGVFGVEPVSYRADGKYRVYQLPLRALVDQGEGFDVGDLTTPLSAFFVSGALPEGATAYLDSVRVRW